jgi:hypothetical protein
VQQKNFVLQPDHGNNLQWSFKITFRTCLRGFSTTSGFQIILSVFYHVVHPNASGVCGARQLGKFCNSVMLTSELHEVITGIFMRYQEVYHCKPITFKDPGYLHCKKFSPLEFLGMSVLIHRYPTHTALKLSQDILEIRHMLLRGNNELLTNNTTWKFFMDTLVEYGACQAALAQRQSSANRHFGSTADGSLALGISPSSTGLGNDVKCERVFHSVAAIQRLINLGKRRL